MGTDNVTSSQSVDEYKSINSFRFQLRTVIMDCILCHPLKTRSDDTLAVGMDTALIKWLMDSVENTTIISRPPLSRIRHYRSCGITVSYLVRVVVEFSFFLIKTAIIIAILQCSTSPCHFLLFGLKTRDVVL